MEVRVGHGKEKVLGHGARKEIEKGRKVKVGLEIGGKKCL